MREIGPLATAAVTLANNLFFFFAISGLGVVTAVTPLVASSLGAGDSASDDIKRTMQQGLWAAAIVSVPGLVCLLNGEAILRPAAPGSGDRAGGRLLSSTKAWRWSLPAFIGYSGRPALHRSGDGPAARRSSGRRSAASSSTPCWPGGLTFGHFGLPELGRLGAGIATAVATWAMFLLLAASLAFLREKFRRRHHLFHRFGRPDLERLGHIVGLGVPIAVTLLFEVAVFNAAAFLMGHISETDLAAHGIAIQIASISFMVPLGLGQAATVRVGMAYGARDRQAATSRGLDGLCHGRRLHGQHGRQKLMLTKPPIS